MANQKRREIEMLSALFSFLGGSVFRTVWGEISHYYTQKQDQQNEIERMRVQGELDAAAHTRNLEALKLQADLGIKTIEANMAAVADKADADAFAQAVADVGKKTGIYWLDVYNGVIRPTLAALSMLVVVVEIGQHGFVLTDWDRDLVGAILGMYVADRSLVNRGK